MSLNSNNSNNKFSILSFNTGSFISMEKPLGSEKYFIENNCKEKHWTGADIDEGYGFCYKNSKELINKLFSNLNNKNIKIAGLQEYRFNFPNIPILSEALNKSFKENKEYEKNNQTNLKYNKEYYNNISSLIVDANQLYLFNKLKKNFKAIVGGIELVTKKTDKKEFYEGIATIIDINLTGKVINHYLINLSNNLPKDQKDIRPALIVVTEKFLLINIHAPWELGLYNLSLNDENFDENDSNHMKIAANNLKEIINKKILEEKINIEDKNIVFLGDFNDTYYNYPNNIKQLGNNENIKYLNWAKPIKTCCYSQDGMEMLNTNKGLYKGYGDYIASSFEIISTEIPYLKNDTSKTLGFSETFNNNVINSLPMSDHAPIICEVDNKLQNRKNSKHRETHSKRRGSNRTHSKRRGSKRTNSKSRRSNRTHSKSRGSNRTHSKY